MKSLFNIKKLSNKDKKQEIGRSMVEILGVLAVIGVLSIGGIWGYTFAMTKYIANETISEINMRAHDISHQMQKEDIEEITMAMGDMTETGFPISARISPVDEDYFEIFVEDVPSNVCRELLNSAWQVPYSIFVDNDEYTASTSICNQYEAVELAYEFHKDLALKDDIDEDDQHDLKRCEHNNDCNCGLCIDGVCQKGCKNGEECIQSFDENSTLTCCPKDKIKNGICCRYTNEKGECCDSQNHCCPATKPLMGADGQCYSCDEPKNINVYGVEQNCGICRKRYLAGGYKGNVGREVEWCSLCGVAGTKGAELPLMKDDEDTSCYACNTTGPISQTGISAAHQCDSVCVGWSKVMDYRWDSNGQPRCCPPDKPLFYEGNCYPCSYEGVAYTGKNSENCSSVCKGRVQWQGACIPACDELRDENGNCQPCSYTGLAFVGDPTKTCGVDVCPGRELKENQYCMPSGCDPETPLRDRNGRCYPCNHPENVDVGLDGTCGVCTQRYLAGGYKKDGVNWCSLCGVAGTSVAEQPMMQDANDTACYSCSHTGIMNQTDIVEARQCDKVCAGWSKVMDFRWDSNGQPRCCPPDKPLFYEGNCYPCDYDGLAYSGNKSDNCSTICAGKANRVKVNDYCMLSDCDPSTPLKDKDGKCYSCSHPNNINVFGVENNCNICENRYLAGGYLGHDVSWCSLCGVAGTSGAGRPLMNDSAKDNPGNDVCLPCSANEVISQTGIKAEYQCDKVCGWYKIMDYRWDSNGQPRCCPPDKPLFYEGTCYPCSYNGLAYTGNKSDNCSTVCTNRHRTEDGGCVLSCDEDHPLHDESGLCYDCNYSGHNSVTPWSGASCTSVCPNREDFSSNCAWAGKCASGYFMGSDGVCYTCKEPRDIPVNNDACKTCSNREPIDGVCRLKS